MSRRSDLKIKVARFISNNEFFWLKDLRMHLGIDSNESSDSAMVSQICKSLHKEMVIVPSNKKGREYQYMRV